MKQYQNLIGLIILSIAIIVGALILAGAIDNAAWRLVRVLQLP